MNNRDVIEKVYSCRRLKTSPACLYWYTKLSLVCLLLFWFTPRLYLYTVCKDSSSAHPPCVLALVCEVQFAIYWRNLLLSAKGHPSVYLICIFRFSVRLFWGAMYFTWRWSSFYQPALRVNRTSLSYWSILSSNFKLNYILNNFHFISIL